MKLTIVEFRKQIREAFNAVERGEEVYITRHNKTFAIIKSPVSFLSTGEKSVHIKPDIQKISPVATQHTPKGENGFYKLANDPEEVNTLTPAELPCCAKAKPCPHWQWSSDKQLHINTLSGREREADL